MKNKVFIFPAMTLIEVMIATTVISLILAAICVTMVYTQRTIRDAQNRAKAVDAANSCLGRFRIARDANNWVNFCKKLEGCNGTLVDGSSVSCSFPINEIYDREGECLNCDGPYEEGGLEIPQATDSYTEEICPEIDLATSRGNDFSADYEVSITECENNNSPIIEQAKVKVVLGFRDFSGNEQKVTVSQDFARNQEEAAYKY